MNVICFSINHFDLEKDKISLLEKLNIIERNINESIDLVICNEFYLTETYENGKIKPITIDQFRYCISFLQGLSIKNNCIIIPGTAFVDNLNKIVLINKEIVLDHNKSINASVEQMIPYMEMKDIPKEELCGEPYLLFESDTLFFELNICAEADYKNIAYGDVFESYISKINEILSSKDEKIKFKIISSLGFNKELKDELFDIVLIVDGRFIKITQSTYNLQTEDQKFDSIVMINQFKILEKKIIVPKPKITKENFYELIKDDIKEKLFGDRRRPNTINFYKIINDNFIFDDIKDLSSFYINQFENYLKSKENKNYYNLYLKYKAKYLRLKIENNILKI